MLTPGTILTTPTPGPTWGHPCVAVIGYVGDFAVYEASYSDQVTKEDIAKSGDKVSEKQARALFPELKDYQYRH